MSEERDSTVQRTGLGHQLEDAIGRAEADWYVAENDLRPLRRAIADDIWPVVSGWLVSGNSDEYRQLWAKTLDLDKSRRALAEELDWYRAEFPDAEYPNKKEPV